MKIRIEIKNFNLESNLMTCNPNISPVQMKISRNAESGIKDLC